MFRVMNKKGAALTEYAVLVGLIGVVAVSSVFALGDSIKNNFGSVDTELTEKIIQAATADKKISTSPQLVNERDNWNIVYVNDGFLFNSFNIVYDETDDITLDFSQLTLPVSVSVFDSDIYLDHFDPDTSNWGSIAYYNISRVIITKEQGEEYSFASNFYNGDFEFYEEEEKIK
jgi:Flp pilus assembly pilin Flp